MPDRTDTPHPSELPHAPGTGAFIWPLGGSSVTPDEMNTSFGPRIDADRWDFHDGIDLPAPVGTPVLCIADGTVDRAGPADDVFGSPHVRLRVTDPSDGQDDLFVVYLHLDSIAAGMTPGAPVTKGDVLGAVGQEDATYPHLHLELRKGGPEQARSVHPLHYLPYRNRLGFRRFRLDRCNFYHDDGAKRMIRLRFDLGNRREGDLLGVDVELTGEGVDPRTLHVDFDDRSTIVSDKGDQHAFNAQGIAVEGYQKSNLKGAGLNDLQYGVLVKDITPEFQSATLRVRDIDEARRHAPFSLPTLDAGRTPIDSRAGFEEPEPFPPPGWALSVRPGNVGRPDEVAGLTGARGLLCQDNQSAPGALIRAGLRFRLPVDRSPRPMSWRLRADIKPPQLQMDRGLAMHPLALLAGDDIVAAACVRRLRSGEFVAGVLMRSAGDLSRESIDVSQHVPLNAPARWDLALLRVGTRQTTAVLRLNSRVVARVNGDTTSVEPDTAFVGILHRHGGLRMTLHVDQLRLTEAPP